MGNLLTSIRIGGKNREIKPVMRRLGDGKHMLSLAQVCIRSGGVILGEGDTGKSTYAKMLCEYAAESGHPASIFPLRRRTLPCSLSIGTEEKPAIVIFDGLDEWPECARDLVDLANGVDNDLCHVWVTSRACDAAALLAENRRFEQIYRLDPFTDEDMEKLVKSVGVDVVDFLDAVELAGVDSIAKKPGGVVLLLQLFANGKLKGCGAYDVMESIMLGFAADSRDGHTRSSTEGEFAPETLADAACWIAACLLTTQCAAVWLGAEANRPPSDLALKDLEGGGFDRRTLGAALGRRLFEPLSSERLRISYSEMPTFLAGRWFAAHADEEALYKLLDVDLNRTDDCELIRWASFRKPELGIRAIEARPQEFTSSHELIRLIGVKQYLLLLLKAVKDAENFTSAADLYPLKEFADLLVEFLNNPKLKPEITSFFAWSLVYCKNDWKKSAFAVLEALKRGGMSNQVEMSCLHALRNICIVPMTKTNADTLKTIARQLERIGNSEGRNRNGFHNYANDILDLSEIDDADVPNNDLIDELSMLSDEDDEVEVDDEYEDPEEYGLQEEMDDRGGEWQYLRYYELALDTYKDEEILSERQVAKLLGSECFDELLAERILAHQYRRGLRYLALERFLDQRISALGDDFEWCDPIPNEAIKCNAPRYLPQILKPLKINEKLLKLAGPDHRDYIMSVIECSPIMSLMVRVAKVNPGLFSRVPRFLDVESLKRLGYLIRLADEVDEIFFQGCDLEVQYWLDMHDFGDDDDDDCEEASITSQLLEQLRSLARPQPEPVKAVVVGVAPEVSEKLGEDVGEKVVETLRDKGGRPRNSDREPGAPTQAEMAKAFTGEVVCTENKVANWEAYVKTQGRRGSRPPTAEINGKTYVYSAELREHPTPENKKILAAIIAEFQARGRIKAAVKAKKCKHFRSEETLHRAKKGQ